MGYILTLVLSLFLCFGAQFLALKASGGRTTKSDSNFFSSVARIQSGIRNSPEIMLLGSSMTGRFPDRNAGFKGVANLGCDGGNALDTLRAIDRGILPDAPILVIEGNTLYRSLSGVPSETANAIDGVWFSVGRKLPLLGATARPSAFAYSRLLEFKIGRAGSPSGDVLPGCEAMVFEGDVTLNDREEKLVAEIDSILGHLKKKNCLPLLVILPPGAADDSANIRLPQAVSRRSNVPLLNLTASSQADSIRFTDGVHLAPDSAALCLRTILASIGDLRK